MTNLSKSAGTNVALALFVVVSAVCGAGWFQAHRRAVELSDQRVRELEQRLNAFTVNENVALTVDGKSRDITNRVFAEVLIRWERPRVIGDRQDIESPRKFEVYRQTQARMVKSPFVLAAVLRNPTIANLSLLKDQPNSAKFLEDRLEVNFPATEFMRISFGGTRSPEAAKIVNAVVTEYLNEVANAESNARNMRISELEKAHYELAETLRARRSALKKLVSNLQTGDREALSEKQKMMIELSSLLRRERAQKHFELMNARIKLAVLEDRGIPDESDEIAEAVIEEQLAANADVQIAQHDIKRRQETINSLAKVDVDPNNPRLASAKRDLEAAQTNFELLKQKTRTVIADRLRIKAAASFQASVSQLRDSVRVTEVTIRQLDEEMEKQKVETQQTGQWSLEIDSLREDLEQTKAIDQRLTGEIERLKIEMKAAPRVKLYREADAET